MIDFRPFESLGRTDLPGLARIPAGSTLRRRLRHACHAYLVPIPGSVRRGDLLLAEGSGAAIVGEREITLEAPGGAEVVLVECS